jgi:hypothetical protein
VPFTLSHPAAAIPLRRWGLVTSALVVGSLAPDFEYFVRLHPQDRYAHTFPGVLLLTLPVALLSLVVFHLVVKRPLISLMPARLRRKLDRTARAFRPWPPRRFGIVLVSLSAGIATHLAWDSFTHDEGWLSARWPALHVPLFHIAGSAIPPYKIFQHGSSLLGLLLLAVWAWQWYRTAPEQEDAVPRFSTATAAAWITGGVLIACAAGATRALHVGQLGYRLAWVHRVVIAFVTTAMAVTMLEILVFSAAWWLWVARRRQRLSASAAASGPS